MLNNGRKKSKKKKPKQGQEKERQQQESRHGQAVFTLLCVSREFADVEGGTVFTHSAQ